MATKGYLLLGFGFLVGASLVLAGRTAVRATSTDAFCGQACHVHPQATQRWLQSAHYSNKSGVVAHCVDCHLPPDGPAYLAAKVSTGARDVAGTVFGDPSAIDWELRRTVERAAVFTWDAACLHCHQNLFSEGLSRMVAASALEYVHADDRLRDMTIVARRMEAHQYYQRNKDRLRCVNCHLGAGHSLESIAPATQATAASVSEDANFPLTVTGFQSYTETIPGTDVKFRLVALPGGTFQMGSPDSEPYRRSDEGPAHAVTVSRFWIGQAEVSWREFDVFFAERRLADPNSFAAQAEITPGYFDLLSDLTGKPGRSPSRRWGKGSQPVAGLTHRTATLYAEWLSQETGKRFRLPTEAEWEYARRAVGLLGNVKEYCLDWYDAKAYASAGASVANPRGPVSGIEHVVRGGSFRSDASELRAAARDHTRQDEWSRTDPQFPKNAWWYTDADDVGFRLVRESEDR